MKLGTLIPTLVLAALLAATYAAGARWWWSFAVLVLGAVATVLLYWRGVSWLEK